MQFRLNSWRAPVTAGSPPLTQIELTRLMRFQSIPPGAKYSRLLVIKPAEPITDRHYQRRFSASVCKCECGNVVIVRNANLKNGHSKSCGCLKLESASITGRQNKKHGQHKSGTYTSWRAMLGRCVNKNNASFSNYGALGIAVCERWKSFENFLSDMGERPLGKSVERLNNNIGYEPANCRWATTKEQNRNRTDSRIVSYLGITACLSEIVERFSLIPYPTVRKRLQIGWSLDRALLEPLMR